MIIRMTFNKIFLRQHNYHYLALAAILLMGIFLRVLNLDLKPLWMDEVITAIFSLGKNYASLPLEQTINFSQIQNIFTYQPNTTCAEITKNLINQSTHPPLFFCAMHTWMGWMQSLGVNWVVGLRLLPVIFGVSAIASTYILARIAFSPKTGLIAAMCMAVSPFAVYLSQEARHYSLPVLIITLALIAQIQIQHDVLVQGRVKWQSWLGWIAINSLGLYIHYFFILVIIAQILTLIGFGVKFRQSISQIKPLAIALLLSVFLLFLTYLPWLQILLAHSNASETDWLPKPQHIAPIYQTLVNWMLMIIALPVEHQPFAIAIPSAILMLLFSIWFGHFFGKQLLRLLISPTTKVSILTFMSISGCLILEILAISYLFNKDITSVPRYSFIWFPSNCILVAVILNNNLFKFSQKQKIYIFLITIIGIISSIFVSYNLVFQKPFLPDKTAQILLQEPEKSILIVIAYRDYQDMALGLSFALGIPEQQRDKTQFALLKQSTNFSLFWQNLAQLETLQMPNLHLWVFAPARKRHDYPSQIITTKPVQPSLCKIDPNQHYRIGIPYQLYRCNTP